MTELKPCPFCGGKAVIWSWNGGTRIDCENWNTGSHLVGIEEKTAEKAIEMWNQRSDEKIYCKDCKKYFPKTEERDSYCPFVGRIGLEPDGYCAWAERKEE